MAAATLSIAAGYARAACRRLPPTQPHFFLSSPPQGGGEQLRCLQRFSPDLADPKHAQITGVAFADDASEVLANYSADHVFLFGLNPSELTPRRLPTDHEIGGRGRGAAAERPQAQWAAAAGAAAGSAGADAAAADTAAVDAAPDVDALPVETLLGML
jgi:hypothetical protein